MMKKPNRGARYAAIDILFSWEKNKEPVDLIMEGYLAGTVLADPRDRQLVMTLVYGVLRWRGYLDWVIEKFSTRPLAKINKRTLQALRIGIFQLLFLDRIPSSAAVNETVQALKKMKQPQWLAGFANGVLRSVNRKKRTIPIPVTGNELDSLPEAAKLSHPQWLIERWKKRYGPVKAETICRANNEEPPVSLRVNTAKTSRAAFLKKLEQHELHPEAGEYSPFAVKLSNYHGPVTALPGFKEGLFQVQDEAAQLVTMLFGALQSGRSYLDGCAGLGGKTSHLAQILPAESGLFAVEPNPARLEKLKANLSRLQLNRSVTIFEGTLDSLLPDYKEKFSGILIDAPCSGLGVIRRHPDIRWNRTPGELVRFREQQIGLLKTAAELLVINGILVYATCSTEPEENREVIQNFVAAEPGFFLSNSRDVLPENCSGFIDGQGFFQTRPGQDDLDGFFAARLIKRGQ